MPSLRPLVAAVMLMVVAPAAVAQAPADQLALALESSELHEDLWLAQLFTATNAEALACASLGERSGAGDRALALISRAARWFLDGAGEGPETAVEEAPGLLCASSTQGLVQFQQGLARFYHDTDAARVSDVRYCTICTLDQQPWSEQGADTVGVPLFLTSFRGASSIYPARTYHLLFLEAEADVGVAPIVILAWPNKNDIDPF